MPVVGACPLPSLHPSLSLTPYSGEGLVLLSTSGTPGALVPGTGMGWEWGTGSAGVGGSEALRTELNSADCERVWFTARRDSEKRNPKPLVLEACMHAC